MSVAEPGDYQFQVVELISLPQGSLVSLLESCDDRPLSLLPGFCAGSEDPNPSPPANLASALSIQPPLQP